LDGQSVKGRYALTDAFVVGWVGSFRKFHGLEIVLEAAVALQAHLNNVALLMIGDGLEKERIGEMARALGLKQVVFTGTIAYRELPQFINAMDVAVLSDSGTTSYHYSPLKLQEYLACGRAIVAPHVGQIAQHLRDGIDSLLVEPGSPSAIVNAIELLYRDDELRHRLGLNARHTAIENGGWKKIVKDVEANLGLHS
jgi:glycosyltransferase involved in cell wall biosynthesis